MAIQTNININQENFIPMSSYTEQSIDILDVRNAVKQIPSKFSKVEILDMENTEAEEVLPQIFEDETVNEIYHFFSSKGLSSTTISAILGNLQYETASTFDPACNWERLHSSDSTYADNEYYDQYGNLVYTEADLSSLSFSEASDKIKGLVPKYGGIGFLQWTGGKFDGETWIPASNGADRKAAYLNWCNANNYKWNDLNTQLEYLWEEYQNWENKDTFESISDVRQAATYFCDHYECPGDSSAGARSDYAQIYLATISSETNKFEV